VVSWACRQTGNNTLVAVNFRIAGDPGTTVSGSGPLLQYGDYPSMWLITTKYGVRWLRRLLRWEVTLHDTKEKRSAFGLRIFRVRRNACSGGAKKCPSTLGRGGLDPVLPEPIVCTRVHHRGRGSRKTKKDVMNKVVGHDSPLWGPSYPLHRNAHGAQSCRAKVQAGHRSVENQSILRDSYTLLTFGIRTSSDNA
jgi:hypothetical protein